MPRTDNPVLPDEKLMAPISEAITKLGAQTLRDKVLSHYHARLAEIEEVAKNLSASELAAKRFRKLSKEQLLILASTFVANLLELNQQGADTEEKIKELALAETALLEKGYPPETIAKNHHPLYINLVKGAIATGQLTLTGQNSYSFDIYNQAGELETIHNHYVQLYLKYDRDFYRQVKQKSNQRNNIKQDTPKPVKLYPYLDKIKELLQSEQYSELAAGIAAATGRRFSEVIERGTFVIPDKPDSVYELIFEGQLKKSTDAPAYSTYSLVPASVVIAAIARLRTMPKISSLQGASIEKINTLLPTVNYQIKRHFQETGIVEVLEGEASVTVHNLRGIYGEIAASFFCSSRAQFPRFLSQQLGHIIADETIDQNLSHSTEHYFHYYLVDENGNNIDSMGIKLNEPLPEKGFVELATEFLTSNDPWCKLGGVIALTGKSPDDLLKHFVYKGVEGQHKILYTHQVHSQLQPYYQIVTLADAAKVENAIAQLKTHPDLKTYIDIHTGKQLLAYVRERIADYLGQLGVETYQLAIQQYQVLVQQMGLEQHTQKQQTVSSTDNKPASIRTVAWVRKEFDEIRQLLGTTNNNETLIEIINLAKLALSHQQKLRDTSDAVTDFDGFRQPELAQTTEALTNTDSPTVIEQAPSVEPHSQQATLSTVNEPAFDNELSGDQVNPETISTTEPDKDGTIAETIKSNNSTTNPQNSSTSSPNKAEVSPDSNLTAAITTLVQSMSLLTNKFDRFLETASSPGGPSQSPHYPLTPIHSSNTNTTVTQTPQRRPRRKTDKAIERIHEAINVVINYNGRVALENRWYISAPVLKALAGGAQVTINETMKNLKPILDEHHQALGLGTQHNRSFHRGEQVTDFVTLNF